MGSICLCLGCLGRRTCTAKRMQSQNGWLRTDSQHTSCISTITKQGYHSHQSGTNLLAIVLLHQSAFDSFGAAIAAIVSTAFVVVCVIAVAVSLVLRRRAGQFA